MARKRQYRLVKSPVRHELTAIQANRVGILYRDVQKIFPEYLGTLEEWELGFMRDAHPDREIEAWEWIVSEYRRMKGTLGHSAARWRAIRLSTKRLPITCCPENRHG